MPPLWQEMPVANGVPSGYQPIYMHGGSCPFSLKVAYAPQTNRVLACMGYDCAQLDQLD